MAKVVTKNDIIKAIRSTHVASTPVCIHGSLRSFGWVEGGASTVVQAFLDKGCTVMAPTFTYEFDIPPPAGRRPPRNGMNYEVAGQTAARSDQKYSITSNDLTRGEMGSIPAAILAIPTRVRGNHPINSFAAVGPLAAKLVSGQRPLDVYAPLRALVEHKGSVILMGVGLTKLTILHLAEQQAGRNLFRRWASDTNGNPIEVEVGSCSEGFGNLTDVLSGVCGRVNAGPSPWLMLPAGQMLRQAVAAIRKDPQITHCANPLCLRCNDAVEGGPLLER